MAEKWRTFIAIDPGKTLQAEVDRLQSRLQGKTGPGVRWTPPAQVHLTLKFLGDVSAEHIDPLAQALKRACAGTGPLELVLDGAGCFPSFKKPSVIWVGLGGDIPALRQLQKRIDGATQEFSGHQENRDFHPHLTIGRVKARLFREQQRIGAVLQSTKVAELGRWTARDVLLVHSKTEPAGSVYTTIATAPL